MRNPGPHSSGLLSVVLSLSVPSCSFRLHFTQDVDRCVFYPSAHANEGYVYLSWDSCNEGILVNPPLARPSRFCPRSWSNREWWWIFPELTVTLLVCLYSVAAQLSRWIFISMTVLMCFTPTRVGLPLNMCTGLLYFVDYPREMNVWPWMHRCMMGKLMRFYLIKQREAIMHYMVVTGQGTPSTQQAMNPNSLEYILGIWILKPILPLLKSQKDKAGRVSFINKPIRHHKICVL